MNMHSVYETSDRRMTFRVEPPDRKSKPRNPRVRVVDRIKWTVLWKDDCSHLVFVLEDIWLDAELANPCVYGAY